MMFVLLPFNVSSIFYSLYLCGYLLLSWFLADFFVSYYKARESGLPKPYLAFIYLDLIDKLPREYRFRQ